LPVRDWAFRDMNFKFEGYHIPDIYKALWNFISDRGYSITEHRYGHGWFGEGAETQACVGIWMATKETEKKYVINGLHIKFKFVWSNAPKPGTSGENAPMVPKGRAEITMHGFIVMDYLNFWGGSFILRPLFNLRNKYFYRRRRDALETLSRQDAEGIIDDIQEFVSFLPTIR